MKLLNPKRLTLIVFKLSSSKRQPASRAQVYISTGAGTLGALPDSKVQGILGRMRPQLRASEYDAAVEQAAIDIGLGLAGAGAHHHALLCEPLALIAGCATGLLWIRLPTFWISTAARRHSRTTLHTLYQDVYCPH